MMEVPQLHGFGPAANRLLEAYKMLLKVFFFVVYWYVLSLVLCFSFYMVVNILSIRFLFSFYTRLTHNPSEDTDSNLLLLT